MADAQPRLFRETPVFSGIEAFAASYAFELRFEAAPSAFGLVAEPNARRAAFRLDRVDASIPKDGPVHKALIEPARSYLDDVTTGPPGHNGRPLLFLASGEHAVDANWRIDMIRPSRWTYAFEGEVTELVATGGQPRAVPLCLRDSFCAFESGRLFYILTLTAPAENPAAVDEYALIQLEQLSLRPETACDHAYVGFSWREAGEEKSGSLIDLAEARLQSLESSARSSDGATSRANAFADIILPYQFQRREERRAALTSDDLRSLCLGVEDEELIATAKFLESFLPAARPEEYDPAAWPKADVLPRSGEPEAHRDEENGLERAFLAFAGITTGVADFPWQDKSEVHDSTRPASSPLDAALYVHPRFLFEVARDWRSFRNARSCLGTCPYLLLMWVTAIHDELTVADMERAIDDMIFDPGSEGYRTVPLDDVDEIRKDASSTFGNNGARLLEENLRRRLDLFRWMAIHRSGNLFRYPKEKQALAMIQQAMGTEDRFDRAKDRVDRIESLVEDVTALRTSYAERRTNEVLALIAFLSVFAVVNDGVTSSNLPTSLLVFALFAATLALLFLRRDILRRFR